MGLSMQPIRSCLSSAQISLWSEASSSCLVHCLIPLYIGIFLPLS
jgi:hypothetical protein